MDSVVCELCKIMFVSSDAVFAGSCGHLFHEACLMRLRERCSACKVICIPSRALRVYLPFSHESSEANVLAVEYRKIKEELSEVNSILAFAQREKQDDDTLIEYRTNQLNEKNAELKLLNKEKESLQKNVKQLEKFTAIQTTMVGSRKDVEKFVEKKQSAETLATVAVMLQRETERVKTEKTEIRLKLREDRKSNEILTANYMSCRDKYQTALARKIQRDGRQNNGAN